MNVAKKLFLQFVNTQSHYLDGKTMDLLHWSAERAGVDVSDASTPPQPYMSLMKDRITRPLPSGPNPKLARTDSASEWEILGRRKSLGANPLILSSFFDLEIPGQ